MAKLDLNALKGKQTSTPSPAPTPTPAPAPAPAGLGFLKKPAAPQTPEVAKPSAPAAPTQGVSKGLGFLKQVAAPTPAPTPPKAADATQTKPSAPVSDDLQELLNHDVGGSAARPAPIQSRFNDEVPAQSPDRDLEGLDKQQLMFVESLDSVYKIVHEPDMLGGVIKSIMMELAAKPEYRKLIQPKDMHTMIKGMRDSMGMARIKKEESKAKRSGGAKKKTKIDDLDTLAALDEAFAGVDL